MIIVGSNYDVKAALGHLQNVHSGWRGHGQPQQPRGHWSTDALDHLGSDTKAITAQERDTGAYDDDDGSGRRKRRMPGKSGFRAPYLVHSGRDGTGSPAAVVASLKAGGGTAVAGRRSAPHLKHQALNSSSSNTSSSGVSCTDQASNNYMYALPSDVRSTVGRLVHGNGNSGRSSAGGSADGAAYDTRTNTAADGDFDVGVGCRDLLLLTDDGLKIEWAAIQLDWAQKHAAIDTTTGLPAHTHGTALGRVKTLPLFLKHYIKCRPDATEAIRFPSGRCYKLRLGSTLRASLYGML